MRYRSKPSEVDAVQWTGENFGEVRELLGRDVSAKGAVPDGSVTVKRDTRTLRVVTPSGPVVVERGFWIARSVTDPTDVWPVSPERFAEVYEEVG